MARKLQVSKLLEKNTGDSNRGIEFIEAIFCEIAVEDFRFISNVDRIRIIHRMERYWLYSGKFSWQQGELG